MQELRESNYQSNPNSVHRDSLLARLNLNLSPNDIYTQWTEGPIAKLKNKRFITKEVKVVSSNATFEEVWKKKSTLGNDIVPEADTAIVVLSLNIKEIKRSLLESLKIFLSISNHVHKSFYLSGLITFGVGGYRAIVRESNSWICLWQESVSYIRKWEYLVKWMVKNAQIPVMLFYQKKAIADIDDLKIDIEVANAFYEFGKVKESLAVELETKKENLMEESKRDMNTVVEKKLEEVNEIEDEGTPKPNVLNKVKKTTFDRQIEDDKVVPKDNDEIKEVKEVNKSEVNKIAIKTIDRIKDPKMCPLCFIANPSLFKGRCNTCLYLIQYL